MSSCPHCGTSASIGDLMCPSCGGEMGGDTIPEPEDDARVGSDTIVDIGAAARHTLVGGTSKSKARASGAPPAPRGVTAGSTLVGFGAATTDSEPDDALVATHVMGRGPQTLVGMPASHGQAVEQREGARTQIVGSKAAAAVVPPAEGGRLPLRSASPTQRGFANPAAPPPARSSGERRPRDEADSGPRELGATAMPLASRRRIDPFRRVVRLPPLDGRGRERIDPKPRAPKAGPPKSKKSLILAAVGAAAVSGALLLAAFWPTAATVTARTRTSPDGEERIEVTCPSCAEGTKVTVGGATGVVRDHVASIAAPSSLPVGESALQVAIERPGGAAESLAVPVVVPFRIAVDRTTLRGEKPSVQIVVEAMPGGSATVDGKALPLGTGRGTYAVDISDSCTGPKDETMMFRREIPYVLTPKVGVPQPGMIRLDVDVLPLRIDAPGPHVVIDGKSFVLAGKTAPGAEVVAAGRSIPVRPDGTFGQVMNVSSVGATQIEVRAKQPDKAPRFARIGVRRVESLETEADEVARRSPVPYADLVANTAGVVGKPIIVGGEVLEARQQNHQTVLLLQVAPRFGCSSQGAAGCRVRLVHGADNTAKPGDTITAYGVVAGSFDLKGTGEIPEIYVDFTLRGLR